MTANPGDAREQREEAPAQRQRPIPADTFGVRLAVARMHAGHLTIREAAERCGLNYGSWSNWENGSKPRDLLDVVGAVSEGLDVNHDWLLFGGPLAGPRGMPTNGQGPLRPRYSDLAERPKEPRPDPARTNTRPPAGRRPGAPPHRDSRRPVRISART